MFCIQEVKFKQGMDMYISEFGRSGLPGRPGRPGLPGRSGPNVVQFVQVVPDLTAMCCFH